MDNALITVEHKLIGKIDISVDRNLEVKKIIWQLFIDLNINPFHAGCFFMKSEINKQLLKPNDTLAKRNIYDGEYLHIF